MVKNAIVIVVAVVAAAVGAWWLFRARDVPAGTASPAPSQEVARRVRPVAPTPAKGSSVQPGKTNLPVGDASSRSAAAPEDVKLMEELRKCRLDENFREMVRVVGKAVKSENPEVRRDALDAIRAFGKNGMAEATMFMCDADEDVRNEAFDVWRSALFEFEDDGEKAKHIQMAMTAVTDREQLELMTQQITELDDFNRMNTLVTLITGKNAAAKDIALREYKDLTETEFTTVDAAQAWLNERDDGSNGEESETEKKTNEK